MPTIPIQFRKAQRLACKAAIMIEGLTGKGKSGLAIAIATGLTKGDYDKIAAVDTENRSLNLFVGLKNIDNTPIGQFNVFDLDSELGFRPTNYLAVKEAAIKNDMEVLIEDSISHAWQYKGGILDLLTEAKTRQKNKNDAYAAWGDAEIINEKNSLLEMIRDSRIHVITTVRVKEKFEYDTTGDKSKLVSLGEQQLQQADLKYEPDLVLHMLVAGRTVGKLVYPVARVIKSRYAIFTEGEEYEFTPELIEQLRIYLAEGVDPDVLLEQTRKEYAAAIKQFLDSHPTAKTVWNMLKAEAGYEETKLNEIPLHDLKQLFIKITA